MKGHIFDIKKFAIHDGDGIRTTVFLKGCPLHCVWCHNPEGISAKDQLAFYQHKCVNCGACAQVCSCHSMKDGVHNFDNSCCIACGKCVDVCLAEALTLYGKTVSADELMPTLMEDKAFYDHSNGGVTLSGGECLLQPEFCAEVLKKCKENGINTAVDTSGCVPWENIESVIEYTDIFLYDIKAIDEDVHIRCTGVTNKKILENLKKIDKEGKKTEIRVPYVPGFNDSQTEKIAKFISELQNVTKVRVLAYHDFARSKYASLQMEDTMPPDKPEEEQLEAVKEIFRANGIICE